MTAPDTDTLIALAREGRIAVVPVEATEDMAKAGARGRQNSAISSFRDGWAYALASSPTLTPALLALAEERDRLREALAFYANEDNYADRLVTRTCGCCSDHEPAAIGAGGGDEGEVARRALTGDTP